MFALGICQQSSLSHSIGKNYLLRDQWVASIIQFRHSRDKGVVDIRAILGYSACVL